MTNRRSFIAGLCAAPLLGLQAGRVRADIAAVYAEGGVAISGADAVAYTTERAHVPGRTDLGLRWHGTVWLFSSLHNRDAFEMNPHRFAPRFGGYCAYMLAQGVLAPTDPQAFSLFADELFLMHDQAKRDLWLETPAQFVEIADRNWHGLRRSG